MCDEYFEIVQRSIDKMCQAREKHLKAESESAAQQKQIDHLGLAGLIEDKK